MRYRVLSVLLFFSTVSFAQTPNTEFFDKTKNLSWLGIDFSKVLFIEDEVAFQTVNVPEVVKSWNEMMITEQKKYNVAQMLHRQTISYAVDVASKHNAGLPFNKVVTADIKKSSRFTPDTIQAIVSTYDFQGLKGNGIMLNVETFNKIESWDKAYAYIWITFVDMDNKKVLFTRRVKGEDFFGFGIKNYWASAFLRVMKEVDNKYFYQWSKRA